MERVERGERVLPEALDRIGVVFGFPTGYYTALRVPLTPEELAAPGASPYPNLAFVKVAALHTQNQFRALARCDVLMYAPLDGQLEYPKPVGALFELIQTLALRLVAPSLCKPAATGGLRELYSMLADQIDELRRGGYAVISGIDEDMHSGCSRKVGVIGIAQRSNDPGILRRKILMLDRRDFSPAGETLSEPAGG